MSLSLYQNYTTLFWGYLVILIAITYNSYDSGNEMIDRIQTAAIAGLPLAFVGLALIVSAEPGGAQKNAILLTALASLLFVGFVNDTSSAKIKLVQEKVASPLLSASFAAVPIVLASGLY